MAYWQKRVDNLKQKKNKNSFDQSHIAHLTNLINQKKDIMENAKTALRNAGENAWVDKFEIDSSPEKERLELEQELEELMNQ